jgi:SAM-dependent methyltransferase
MSAIREWMRDAINRWLNVQAARPNGALAPLIGRWLEFENRAINEAAIRTLKPRAGEAILEVGCGPGWALSRLALSDPERLAAVDPSAAMARRARRRTPRLRSLDRARRLDVRCAYAEALPFATASYDAAISVNAVYFWRPPLLALQELRRVIRGGGRLVLAVEAPEELADVGATAVAGFNILTPHEVCAICETAGFCRVTVERVIGSARRAYCINAMVPATPS